MRMSVESAATVGVGCAEDSFSTVAGDPREGLIQARIVGGIGRVEVVEGDIVLERFKGVLRWEWYGKVEEDAGIGGVA